MINSKHSAVRIITPSLHFPRVYKPTAACAQCGRRGLEKVVVGKGGGLTHSQVMNVPNYILKAVPH